MEHFRTWRETISASGPQEYDELNLYWPFGFPRDFLVYCRYFAEAALWRQFPWCRAPCPQQPPIFMTLCPLYVPEKNSSGKVTPEKFLDGEIESESEDDARAMPRKRIFAATIRSAIARDAARHLFAGKMAAKEPRTEEQRAAIELYPQIYSAVGGVGIASHIIKSLVSGCGSHGRHSPRNSYRDGCRIIARIFGSKRHGVLFPYFNGLYHSIPRQSMLACSIQVNGAAICARCLCRLPKECILTSSLGGSW
jgi:hypothetical protein